MNDLRPQTQLKKAIIFVVAAAFFNTLMIVFVKFASASQPTTVIIFARCLIMLIIILPLVYFNSEHVPMRQFLKTDRPYLHLLRDSLGLVSIFCYFYAAKKLSLASATLLFNTAPLFIPIISYFWGGFKIIHRLWWGMGLGFIGVLLLLHPGHEIFHLPAIIGLISGITAAIVYVGSRYLLYTEPPLRNMFYYFFIGTLITLIVVLATSGNFLPLLNAKAILLLLCVGVMGYLYQLCFTYATKQAPVRLTSSFLYLGVVFSMIADWLIWNVLPNSMSVIGMIIVILGACLMLFLYPHDKDTQKR